MQILLQKNIHTFSRSLKPIKFRKILLFHLVYLIRPLWCGVLTSLTLNDFFLWKKILYAGCYDIIFKYRVFNKYCIFSNCTELLKECIYWVQVRQQTIASFSVLRYLRIGQSRAIPSNHRSIVQSDVASDTLKSKHKTTDSWLPQTH